MLQLVSECPANAALVHRLIWVWINKTAYEEKNPNNTGTRDLQAVLKLLCSLASRRCCFTVSFHLLVSPKVLRFFGAADDASVLLIYSQLQVTSATFGLSG